MAHPIRLGTFTETGVGREFGPYYGKFNIVLDGSRGSGAATDAIVEVEASFDKGETWTTVEEFDLSQGDVVRIGESVDITMFRFKCTYITFGAVDYRMCGLCDE